MESSTKELAVTTAPPVDLFENARFHGSRKKLLGSILNTEIPFEATVNKSNPNRRIFILRHGERVDYIFPEFAIECFDADGNYIQRDLNMPKTLPRRQNPIENWEKDCPLTNIGVFQSEMIGKGVAATGQTFDTVICSPMYRCVMTCDAFLRGAGLRDKIKICIDAALYEWTGWKMLHGWDTLGTLFTPNELAELGYNIDLMYEPIMMWDTLKYIKDETFTQVQRRNEAVVDKALTNPNAKNILVVAHGSNLMTCTYKYVDKPQTGFKRAPFASFIGIEERNDKSKWDFMTPPLASMTHAGNHRDTWEMPDKMKNNAKLLFGKK